MEVCCHARPASLRPQPARGRPDRLGRPLDHRPAGLGRRGLGRTDAIGPDDRRRELLDYLDARVGYTPHQKARQLFECGELSWSQDTTVTLYDDETITVVGNPRRSFGYLYVGAWFKADLAADEPPPS